MTGATTLTALDLASLALLAALALLWFAARRLSPPRDPRGSRPSGDPAMGTETLGRYRPADFVALVDPAAAPLTPSGLSRSGRSLASPDPAAAPILGFLDPAARLVEEALGDGASVLAAPPLALVWGRYLIMLLMLLVLLRHLVFG